ncbi:hypothetical protein ACFL28_05300 [Candidatus Omnitrophota bacterium]
MKVLYEIDPHNRLILRKDGTRSNIRKFRKIVSGRFKTDNKNRLYYEVFKSSGEDTPQKIKFSGTYSFDKKHNLILTLNKWNNQIRGNRIRLRTKFIHASAGEIAFLLSSRESRKKRSVYLMRLHGSWKVDKNNRLTFGVKKEMDKRDVLTLFNAWRINKDNEISYNCNHNSQNIVLKGAWQVKDRYRLSYILDKRIHSGFNFRASLGQVVPRGRKIYIKFDVVIDISKRKRVKRNVMLRCKFKRGKGRSILLEISPNKEKISLKLTRKILGRKGLAYIESFLKRQESYFGGGLALRW